MKKVVVLSVWLAMNVSASWAEVGIGASVKADDASVYIPWQIGSHLRLEGEFRRLERESDDIEMAGIGFTEAVSIKDESKEYGLGLFWTENVNSDIVMLLGLRANYIELERTFSSSFSTSTFTDESLFRSELDGIEIAPTLGLEYAVSSKLRVAAEINYFKRSLEGTGVETDSGGIFFPVPATDVISRSDLDVTEKGTNSRLVVRLFF